MESEEGRWEGKGGGGGKIYSARQVCKFTLLRDSYFGEYAYLEVGVLKPSTSPCRDRVPCQENLPTLHPIKSHVSSGVVWLWRWVETNLGMQDQSQFDLNPTSGKYLLVVIKQGK